MYSLKLSHIAILHSHSRFLELIKAEKFKEVLNKQDRRIQYTMEVENQEKSLDFLEIRTINSGKGKYEFDIFRKKAITNVQIKPASSHDPRILQGVFKGFVHRAFRICSENYIEKELEFLISVFEENGYQKVELRKIIEDVRRRSSERREIQEDRDDGSLPTVALPYLPGISTKLRKAFKKAGYKTAFKSGANLQTILSSKNKASLPKNSQPGTYSMQCKCFVVPPYIGETKIQIRNRSKQHEEYVRKGYWSNSGAACHAKTCKAGFEEVKTIKVDPQRFSREVREALEIQKNKSGPKEGGINKDDGKHVKTKFWIPMLNDIQKKETKEPEIRAQRRIRYQRRQQLQQLHRAPVTAAPATEVPTTAVPTPAGPTAAAPADTALAPAPPGATAPVGTAPIAVAPAATQI